MSNFNRWSRTWLRGAIVASLLFGSVLVAPTLAGASPFACYVTQTFTEEMAEMAIVAIARGPAAWSATSAQDEELPKATFVISQVLKGDKSLVGKQFSMVYISQEKPGDQYLIMAADAPGKNWTTPLLLTPATRDYLLKLGQLPKAGPERLKFFPDHFEHADEMIARDVFDECDDAPFAELQELKPRLKHDQLVEWIQNPDVPGSRRRLYFKLLSICGGPQDLPLLEKIFASSRKEERTGLDAAIECYLTLRGAAGLPLVEELFIRNQQADYAETYSAIMALRTHVTERQAIPRERAIASLRLMLERPDLADLVIPDLARWEDWSLVDEVFAAFKNSNEDTKWIRVPAIQYLRRCPLKEAKEHLRACERLDPASVRRANEFFTRGPTP